jgi:transcriptional regulator with XRE-family HTH domain
MPVPWSLGRIKERILARLIELDLTLEDLPGAIRKGFAEGGSWEEGRSGPTWATLQATAQVLRFTVPDLLGAPRVVSAPDPQALAAALRIAIGVMVPAGRECPLQRQSELLAQLAGAAYSILVVAARERPDIAYSEAGEFMVSSQIRNLWQQTLSENP